MNTILILIIIIISQIIYFRFVKLKMAKLNRTSVLWLTIPIGFISGVPMQFVDNETLEKTATSVILSVFILVYSAYSIGRLLVMKSKI